MGQEVGHAFEDLLGLVMPEICRAISSHTGEYKPGSGKHIEGISSDIDHFITKNVGGLETPAILFMEKHSDSSNESEKHLRRHIEEYAQAARASQEIYGYPTGKSMLVINLIYGMRGGWKEEIISDAKSLIKPTLVIYESDFYQDLVNLITESIESCGRSANRKSVAIKLSEKRNELPVERFTSLIVKTIKDNIHNAIIPDWLSISNTTKSLEMDGNLLDTMYYRRAVTDILCLPEKIRKSVLKNLSLGEVDLKGFSLREIQIMRTVITGSYVSGIGNGRLILGKYFNSLGGMENLRSDIEYIEEFYFNKPKVKSRDYINYFDLDSPSIVTVSLFALLAVKEMIAGRSSDMKTLITNDIDAIMPGDVVKNAVPRNLYLEAAMSALSIAAAAKHSTRKDLSNSKLASLSQQKASWVDKMRLSNINERDASLIVAGMTSFIDENNLNDHKVIEYIDGEIDILKSWANIEEKSKKCLSDMLDPQRVSGISWYRHNQIHSHPIFNPITAIMYRNLVKTSSAGDNFLGFPDRRSISPTVALYGESRDKHEFSIVIKRSSGIIEVFESSSVINLKHSSDKAKELCTRARLAKIALGNSVQCKFTLLIDGDWREQHVIDLKNAGWDRIIYINEVDKL